MGEEWAVCIMSDCQRLAGTDRLTVKPATVARLAGRGGGGDDVAWVESEELEDEFPALAEVVTCLHGLPFEVNGKGIGGMKLSRSFRGEERWSG
ncbi:unnamed protein product [Discosporangium mesarthrocarpum]